MNYRAFALWRPAALLAVLIALAPATVLGQGKWWQSERYQRELQLTGDQIARIEEVFQTSLPELRQQKHELDRLETQLSRLIDTSADEDAVMAEADRVEKVRTGLSKCRTRMLPKRGRPPSNVRPAAMTRSSEPGIRLPAGSLSVNRACVKARSASSVSHGDNRA